MTENDNGYVLESTGKVIEANGAWGFSLYYNELRLGFDQLVVIQDEDFNDIEFTPEEKKEIATFAILEWKKWANINL